MTTPNEPQKPKKVTFTTDSQGNPSTMRGLCIGSFIVAAIIALALASDKVTFTAAKVDLVLYFLGGAFGGKAAQKFIAKD